MEEEKKTKKEIEKELQEKRIEEMKVLSEKLDTQKEELSKLIELRGEQMEQARKSGTADAGQEPEPEETEDEKIKRESKEFLKGTGLDF